MKMKIIGYRNKVTGRIAMKRWWQWTIIGTPTLKKEYVMNPEFVATERSPLNGEEWEKVDLLDYEKKILPHLTVDGYHKPIDFVKARLFRHLTVDRDFNEVYIKKAIHSGCITVEEVKTYLIVRGYKQAKFM